MNEGTRPEDTERMDWLEKWLTPDHWLDISIDGGVELACGVTHDVMDETKGKTLREAVDRAMHPEDFV